MRNLLLLFLFASSVCFAQKDSLDRDYYTTVFSGGMIAGYRFYNGNSEAADLSNHFTFGFNCEANLKLQDNFYMGLGFEESFYTVEGGHSITSFYAQPSLAFNIHKGVSTIFGGIRGDAIFDGRFLGFGIEPFVRMQFNLPDNACIGYHFGVQKFGGNRIRIGGDPAGLPPEAHFEGFNLINYFYFGIRLNK